MLLIMSPYFLLTSLLKIRREGRKAGLVEGRRVTRDRFFFREFSSRYIDCDTDTDEVDEDDLNGEEIVLQSTSLEDR